MSRATARKMTAAVESESKGRATRARAVVKRAQLTVGDLIAAAYDALGNEARVVAKVLSSPDLAVAIHRRIVVV